MNSEIPSPRPHFASRRWRFASLRRAEGTERDFLRLKQRRTAHLIKFAKIHQPFSRLHFCAALLSRSENLALFGILRTSCVYSSNAA